MQSESIKNIAAAIIKVMQDVKGIEKSMTVGSGANAYQGVPDQEVKKIIGESMAKNGLSILPTSVIPKTQVDRWEENNQYGIKQKQSVFTEVTTTYLLLHESGEYLELSGYGHGVDSQDKGAGKATTYALKYTLLYTFLVPTGKIDDTDKIHSDTIETPKTTAYNHKELGTKEKPLISNAQFKSLMERVRGGDVQAYTKAIETFSFESTQKSLLQTAIQTLKQPA
jgi:hypothetical protein